VGGGGRNGFVTVSGAGKSGKVREDREVKTVAPQWFQEM